MADTYFHPLVYDEVAQLHREVPAGVKIDPSHIPLSAELDNTIKVRSDGLYVKLVLDKDWLSKEDKNYLRFGSDGGLYVSGNDILSNESTNLLGISSVDGKLYLDPSKLLPSQDEGNALKLGTDGKFYVDTSKMVSTDTGNQLIAGTDGKLFVKLPDAKGFLTTGPSELLFIDNEGKLAAQVELEYDTASGLLSMLDRNGNTVASAKIAAASSLVSAVIVTNPVGQIAGKYLELVFRLSDGTDKKVYVSLTDLVDVYLHGAGIDIVGNVVSVRIAVESGLSFDESGALFVVADELRSHDPKNLLTVSKSGKLQVVADTLQGVIEIVSKDIGNLIKVGTDGGAYFDLTNVLSSNEDNVLTLGTDGKLYLDEATLRVGVSGDAGNVLRNGTDGRAFWDGDFGII